MKHAVLSSPDTADEVAPLVGAWIETLSSRLLEVIILSHPSWVRGLKRLLPISEWKISKVAPLVGAWIETF